MGIIKDIHGDIEREAALLLDRYRDTLMLEALALSSGDSHAAEELVLQTFEAYLFGRERFDPSKGELLPWLRGILRNIHGKAGRGKSVKAVSYLSQDELELISEIRRQDNSTDEEILSNSDSEVIRKVIEALPDKTRRIIVLRCFESASFGEIARLLGISEISVKNRFYYARKLLARRLGKLLGRAPAIALGVILAGASLLYAAAVVTGLAPMPFAATEPAAEEAEVVSNAKSTKDTEGALTGLTGLPAEGTDPEPAVSSLSSQAPASNHESRTTNRETNGDSPQGFEAITANSETNNEETTMNTQLVKSVAVKAMAAGAMLAAAAPAVSIAADLPDGYKRIEYIQGNGTDARIVTDYIPNPQTDKVEAVVEWPVGSFGANHQQIWCARGNGGTDRTWTLFAMSTSNFRFDYGATRGDLLTPQIAEGVKYTVTADRNVFTWSGGSGQTHTEDSSFQAAGGQLELFASYARGVDVENVNYGKFRLYSFKVWRSGTLIHDFVPCKDPDGVTSMVDVCDNPATLTVHGLFIAPTSGGGGELPTGYTEVEYIQGNGTNARIVTDYIPNPQTDKVEAVVEWPSSVSDALAGNQGVWCARGNGTGSDTWTLHMLGNSGGKFRFDYKSTSGDLLEPALSADVKYTVTADRNVVSWSGGSGQTHTPVSNFIAAGNRMVIFAVYSGATIDVNRGNYGKHRLYSLKVWSSGKLIHYFVPCKDPNGVATMVDICYNAALTIDGTFTAGPEGHYYDDKLFRPAGTVYYIL